MLCYVILAPVTPVDLNRLFIQRLVVEDKISCSGPVGLNPVGKFVLTTVSWFFNLKLYRLRFLIVTAERYVLSNITGLETFYCFGSIWTIYLKHCHEAALLKNQARGTVTRSYCNGLRMKKGIQMQN